MKSFSNLILLIFCLFLYTYPSEAVNNLFPSANDTQLNAARAASDTYYLDVKSKVDAGTCDAGGVNYGLDEALIYEAEGTASYCTSSFSKCSGCNGSSSRNKTRDCFVTCSLAYSICGDVISAGDKTTWESRLDAVQNLVSNTSHGTRPWDTDELVGHSFGIWVYHLAKNGNMSSLPSAGYFDGGWGDISSVPSTGDCYSGSATARSCIKHYVDEFFEGEWIEGKARYNFNTIRYMLFAVNAINNFYGSDKFPEITALFDEIADEWYQGSTPDYAQPFQFGDIESSDVNVWNKTNKMSLLAAVADSDSDDANVWDLWDDIAETGCIGNDDYLWFYDHDATRTKASGQTAFSDTKMGFAHWHNGWDNNDTYFYHMNKQTIKADHDWDGIFNFNVYRNGGWAIKNPKHYYGNDWDHSPWLNTFLMYGAFTGMEEARGPMAYESGSKYLYTGGVSSGFLANERYDDPPPPFVDEFSNQRLSRHNSDGSETIFDFYRIKACNPDSSTCMSTWKKNRIGAVTERYLDRAGTANWDHVYLIHTGTSIPTQSGSEFDWTAENGDAIELYTFIDGPTVTNVSLPSGNTSSPYWFRAQGFITSESSGKNQLRLSFNAADDYTLYAPLNVISIGDSDPEHTYTEITSTSNEDTQGAMVETSTERVVALFNADNDTTTTFTSSINGPPNGFSSLYDPNRFSKAEAMSHFELGSSVSFSTNDTKNIDVFILGLDHTKSWTITANGSSAGCTVSSAGVCNFTITGAAQTHNVTWSAGASSCSSSFCSLCSNQTDCENNSCFWYNNMCQSEDPCLTVPSACTSQSACLSAGHCYENGQCLLSCEPPSGIEVTITPDKDVFIRNGQHENTNYDTQGLNVKHTSNRDFHRSSVVEWDLGSNLPANVQINSCEIEVTVSGNGNNSARVNAFPMLREWVETEATANNWKSGSAWTTKMALGDGTDMTGNGLTGANALTSYDVGGAEVDGDKAVFSSTQAMVDYCQQNASGKVNLVFHQEENDDANFTFYDSENATSSNHPALKIIYEETQSQSSGSPSLNGGLVIGRWGGG